MLQKLRGVKELVKVTQVARGGSKRMTLTVDLSDLELLSSPGSARGPSVST